MFARRLLRHDVAQRKSAKTSKQHADLQEKRNTLSRRIQQWREVQLAYMPNVAVIIVRAGSEVSTGDPDVVPPLSLPENTPLYLPSALSVSARALVAQVSEKELRLRMAQADEALEDVRRGRRMITGLVQFKKLNISGAGNRPNTRMRTLYNRLQLRIQHAAERYRCARDALLALDPNGAWKDKFQKLNATDIRGPGRQEDDPVRRTNNRYEISWIWLVTRDLAREDEEEEEEEFDESMRAEWAKMRARRDRWEEEYQLVPEEMRRTVAYLEWRSDWWKAQADRRIVQDIPLAQGIRAYALRQSSFMTALAFSSVSKWIGALRREEISTSWADKYFDAGMSSSESDRVAPVEVILTACNEGEDESEELDGNDGVQDDDDDESNVRFDRYDLED